MRLFLSQSQLETWALADQADVREGRLVVASEGGAGFPVTPAVHFLRLVTGPDSQRLVAKVKTQAQLDRLGAEHMADSVVLDETAYEVESGYVTDIAPPPAQAPGSEADLLAAFLLDRMG